MDDDTLNAMVRALEANPGMCITVNPAWVNRYGVVRFVRDGKRWNLPRYLELRLSGMAPPPIVDFRPTCRTKFCQNPAHHQWVKSNLSHQRRDTA
jgi:hypothetical protein